MSSKKKKSRRSDVPGAARRFLKYGIWVVPMGFAAVFFLIFHTVRSVPSTQTDPAVPSCSTLLESSGYAARGSEGPRVAIVIDDLGADMGPVERLLDMEIPVTLAVLPYQKFSREAARKAFRSGKEVLLHVPLQPRDYPMTDPGPGSLLVSMDRQEIQLELNDQIASLPHCIGVNPHMGSLFEERPGVLTSLIAVIKERDLLLVDNGASPASHVSEVARTYAVPFVQRTHFLDEKRDEVAIIRQLCRLADFAAGNGWGLGIGHPYPETLAALPRVQAAFREKNITLVPVSGLFPPRSQVPVKAASAVPGPRNRGGIQESVDRRGAWTLLSFRKRLMPES